MNSAYSKQVIEVLRNLNPWWRTNSLHTGFLKPFRHALYYEAMRHLVSIGGKRVVLISGLKRIGKTTVMYQIIDSLLRKKVSSHKIVFIPLRHPVFLQTSLPQIVACYRQHIYSRHDAYFFLDEIEHSGDWEHNIDTLCEQLPLARVVASISVLQRKNIGVMKLRKRFQIVRALPLSFYEYCALTGLDLPSLPAPSFFTPTAFSALKGREQGEVIRKILHLQPHFRRFLTVGGFPELALSGNDYLAAKTVCDNVLDTLLRRDIPALFLAANPAAMEKTLIYLCRVTSDTFSLEAMWRNLEESVPRHTLADYISYMEQSHLIHVIEPSQPAGAQEPEDGRGSGGNGSFRGNERMNRVYWGCSPKIYIADAAIRNALFFDTTMSENPREMGKNVETAVYKHLTAYYRHTDRQIGYFRSEKEGREIDIVVSSPREQPLFIEVKYRKQANITEKDAIWGLNPDGTPEATLVVTKLANDYGLRLNQAGVPIVRIPAFAFLYLSGLAEWERERSDSAAA